MERFLCPLVRMISRALPLLDRFVTDVLARLGHLEAIKSILSVTADGISRALWDSSVALPVRFRARLVTS